MEYNYKKLSAVDILEETTDATTVLIEEDGKIKRIQKDKMVPANVATTEDLAAVEEKIPTDTVTSGQLQEVRDAIPTDTVTSEQLEESIFNLSDTLIDGSNGKLRKDVLPSGYPYRKDYSLYDFGIVGNNFNDVTVPEGATASRNDINYGTVVYPPMSEESGFYFDTLDDLVILYEVCAAEIREYKCTNDDLDGNGGFTVELPSASSVSYNAETRVFTVNVGVTYSGLFNSRPICLAESIYECIDDSYISETIARVSDIPESFSGSWNDLTDRPFGEETVTNVIIEEQTVEFDSTSSEGWDSNSNILDDNYRGLIIEGNTYIVNWNGTEYECECKKAPQYYDIYIGNEKYLDYGDEGGNGLPFAIAYNQWKGYIFTGSSDYTKNAEPVTLSIYMKETKTTPIDSKFIGEDITRVADIPKHLPFEVVSMTHVMDEDIPNLFMCSHTYEQVKSMYDSGKDIAAFINRFEQIDEENSTRICCNATEVYFSPGSGEYPDAIVFVYRFSGDNSQIMLTTEACFGVLQ